MKILNIKEEPKKMIYYNILYIKKSNLIYPPKAIRFTLKLGSTHRTVWNLLFTQSCYYPIC